MKIKSVEFVGALAGPRGDLPDDTLPQVAFSGRSNVGKSSLINTLLRRTRTKIARVSSSPGKTREINFYRVNDRFVLVDLPGFGFAKVPREMREAWKPLVEGYMGRSAALRGVVHLVDCRREPTEQDLEMMDYLARLGVPTLVVLTKMDKLNRSQRMKAVEKAAARLGIDREQLLPFSSKTGEGRDTLLAALDTLLTASAQDGAGSVDGDGTGGEVA